jgi:hypothetical protein
MEKSKSVKKIISLAEEMIKTGDGESALGGHALKFVALFLALGHIDLIMQVFGAMASLIKRTEGEEEPETGLITPVKSDIIVPN